MGITQQHIFTAACDNAQCPNTQIVVKTTDPPFGWISAWWKRSPEASEVRVIFCSLSCAATYFARTLAPKINGER